LGGSDHEKTKRACQREQSPEHNDRDPMAESATDETLSEDCSEEDTSEEESSEDEDADNSKARQPTFKPAVHQAIIAQVGDRRLNNGNASTPTNPRTNLFRVVRSNTPPANTLPVNMPPTNSAPTVDRSTDLYGSRQAEHKQRVAEERRREAAKEWWGNSRMQQIPHALNTSGAGIYHQSASSPAYTPMTGSSYPIPSFGLSSVQRPSPVSHGTGPLSGNERRLNADAHNSNITSPVVESQRYRGNANQTTTIPGLYLLNHGLNVLRDASMNSGAQPSRTALASGERGNSDQNSPLPYGDEYGAMRQQDGRANVDNYVTQSEDRGTAGGSGEHFGTSDQNSPGPEQHENSDLHAS
jgi:hypothetical protein